MDELREMGFRTIPLTVIGDVRIQGFRPQELSDALQLGIKAEPRDPAETIPLLDRLLLAAQRAVRQLPDDKLEHPSPDRELPLREFGFHIFRIAQRTFQEGDGISIGLLPLENPTNSNWPGPSYQSFGQIVEFGKQVVQEYRAWTASHQDLEALKRPPEGGGRLRSGADQLDVIAGHTTQHLRQMYTVLEGFGITPEERIQDSELPPKYVLTILF